MISALSSEQHIGIVEFMPGQASSKAYLPVAVNGVASKLPSMKIGLATSFPLRQGSRVSPGILPSLFLHVCHRLHVPADMTVWLIIETINKDVNFANMFEFYTNALLGGFTRWSTALPSLSLGLIKDIKSPYLIIIIVLQCLQIFRYCPDTGTLKTSKTTPANLLNLNSNSDQSFEQFSPGLKSKSYLNQPQMSLDGSILVQVQRYLAVSHSNVYMLCLIIENYNLIV